MGIYSSSFVKDLVCSPRPFSPPVIRLSENYIWIVRIADAQPSARIIRNMVSVSLLWLALRANQTGFPSSHATNTVSIALCVGLWQLNARDRMGGTELLLGLTCELLSSWLYAERLTQSRARVGSECRWRAILSRHAFEHRYHWRQSDGGRMLGYLACSRSLGGGVDQLGQYHR